MECNVDTVFSTKDVHPRNRFEFWHDIACANLVGHESRVDHPQSFHAELQSGAVDDIGIVRFTNSVMVACREQRHISHASDDALFLCHQFSGAMEIEQNSREITLAPRTTTLLDPMLPYSARFKDGSNLLVVKLPRRDVEARIGNTRELTCRLPRQSIEWDLMSDFVSKMPGFAGRLTPVSATLIRNQILDLVGIALSAVGENVQLSNARSVALTKMRAIIDSRLPDPALDAEEIAGAAGVSTRYAAELMKDAGTSIMQFVLERRLARCREALADPLQSHRSISEIAYRWGFSDMTHFGRRFRTTYGVLPRDYRRLKADGK
jgi:AraC-like DNA-binding protein